MENLALSDQEAARAAGCKAAEACLGTAWFRLAFGNVGWDLLGCDTTGRKASGPILPQQNSQGTSIGILDPSADLRRSSGT